MPLFAKLVSSSAFTNGDSFAIVEGNQQPIRVKRIIRCGKTSFVVFSLADKPGLEYSGEIIVPDHPVLCPEGSYLGEDEFLEAKTLALRQSCSLGPPQPIRVTGPVAEYVSRIGNLHGVAIGERPQEITIWHIEPPDGNLSKFWFACKEGIWRAESHLGTRQGFAAKATF